MRSSASANCAIPAAVPSAVSSVTVPPAKPRTKGKARPEAQPYQEGTGYAIRSRYKGSEIYLSGCATEAAATKAARQRRDDIDAHGAPKGRGPENTTVAKALQMYGLEHFPSLKGPVQDARRVNRYLRAARLPTLAVVPIGDADKAPKDAHKERYFAVYLDSATSERKIPAGLKTHRARLLTKSADSERHRLLMAGLAMSQVTRDHV